MVKRALCCGINYKRHENFQLYGCSNDCLDWVELFKSTFQFDDVRVLIDEHPDGSLATAPTQIPTRANILAQLNWLCSGAEPGDCLAFVFAGHGCQVRSSYAPVAGALVPEDFDQHGDSGPSLVMDDELHALFQRLPPGSFITVVLDCCHAELMLDVPCSMDCNQGSCRTQKSCERPREVPDRTEDAWRQVALADRMKHAYARPRFMPTVTLSGPPRQRRTPEGSGAHVGRMTLDPAVTAFCFSASTGPQTALDANIKAHQRGVMSFCLLEALAATRGRCTYQTLLEKASEKMDDIRSKYMPDMDQSIHLSFCPNSEPREVVVLDPRYANVSQHRLSQLADPAAGMLPTPQAQADQHPGAHQPPRDDDFVPAPAHGPGGHPAASPSSATRPPVAEGNGVGHHHHHHGPQGGPMLYLVIHAAYNLMGKHGERLSPDSSTWVVARLGRKEHKTHTVHGSMATVWSEHNHFSFQVEDPNGAMDVEVLSADHSRGTASLGRLRVPLRSLEPGQWLRRREPLQDSSGAELEFDIRLEPSRQQHPNAAGATEVQHSQGQHRPPSPPSSPAALDQRPPSPQRPPQDAGYQALRPPPAPQDAGFAPLGPPLGEPLALSPGCAGGLGGAAGACGGGRLGGLGPSPPAPGSEFGGSEWGRSGGGRCPPGSIFGTPNLFGSMPHLLPGAGGAAVGAFGSALGGQPGSAALAPKGMAASPYPSASLGLDLNRNGRADLIVQGADLNRNGIPDALEGALAQAPVYAQPQYPATIAAPQMAATGVPFPSAALGAQPTPMGTGAGARVAAAYGLGHATGASGTPMAWQYPQPGATY